MSIREELRWLRAEFEDSTEFDNFECQYGPTLGTCPESNHCVACSLKRFFDRAAVKEEMGL